MKNVSMLIAILVVLMLLGCGDSAEQPVVEVEPQPEPAKSDVMEATDVAKEIINEAVASIIQVDESGFPQMPLGRRKIANNADVINIPLPKMVIDIDDFMFADTAELDRKLGAPIGIVAIDDPMLLLIEIRYYHLFDGNVVGFWIENDEIALNPINNIEISYLRGYPTSIETLKAAGFKENEVTFKKHWPAEVKPRTLAQDTYSAKTENEVYDHISVPQQKGLWSDVYITRRNPRAFDADGNEVERK